MKTIYLDHSATTPLHPQVLEAMLPVYQEHFGNPSSLHSYGRAGRHMLNNARDHIASLLGCSASELIFTSGGTESDNLAISGVVRAAERGHIITSQVEHHAVLATCQALEQVGYDVTYVPVDESGQVSIDHVERAIRPDTLLISLIYGSNEVGTLQPIEAVGHLARERGILFHVDAVQALGKVPIKLDELPVDLMSFSAHKINGPKGVGLLYASATTVLHPLMSGGAQERKRRAGTENVAGIVGMAKALELAEENREQNVAYLKRLRQTMLEALHAELGAPHIHVNGHREDMLPHILNISFPLVDTETMLMNLDINGIAAASGSACSSGSLERSHVIRAMQLPDDISASAIRFSFGRENTEEEVTHAANIVATIVKKRL